MRKVASLIIAGVAIAGTICFLPSVRCADKAETQKIQQEAISQAIEKRLAKWEPDHEDLSPVVGKIFRPKADIIGEWTTDVNFDGSFLSVQKKESGEYSVDLSTSGCLASWALKRSGTYKAGVFHLNKPVEEYSSDPYDTLYAVSVNGTEYLISQAAIRFVVKNYSKNGVVDWPENIKSNAFHRKEKAKGAVSK